MWAWRPFLNLHHNQTHPTQPTSPMRILRLIRDAFQTKRNPFIRAPRKKIQQGGNSQREQAYYYHYS
jgi:hypothetical protein